MKLSKPTKMILLIFVCIIIFGLAVNKTYYVGDVSCKGRIAITIFGIKISAKETPSEMADYLASMVGNVPEHKYHVTGRGSLLFGRWWVVGTPQGNWFWVHTLKNHEENGLPHEIAVEIARGLVSEDGTARGSAIQRIRSYRSNDNHDDLIILPVYEKD